MFARSPIYTTFPAGLTSTHVAEVTNFVVGTICQQIADSYILCNSYMVQARRPFLRWAPNGLWPQMTRL